MSPDPVKYQSLDAADPAIDRSGDFAALSDEQFMLGFFEPMMWQVSDFPDTAWWGHLQFMFATIDLLRPRRFVELGSHRGTSFFSANQAAQRVGIDMEALAVDSWLGDDHAGKYDEEVYSGFIEVLERRNYGNAKPLRMFFDDAADLFEPQSVDLLHIDGLHTYEAVSHDYNTWIDKVVPGGLILFHDINVHQKDFGVWRLWDELSENAGSGRSFAFKHSHGLGVLQKEGDGFPQLTRLLSIFNSQPEYGSFTQLLLATVSELAHKSRKFDDLAKAIGKQRDARKVAEQRAENAKKNYEHKEQALKAQAEQLRLQLRNLESASGEAQLRAELAAKKATAEQRRVREEMAQTVHALQAGEGLESPSVTVQALRKVRGQSPVTVQTTGVAEGIRQKMFAAELERSGLFDEEFYRSAYSDVDTSGEGALQHFVKMGRYEDRQPNEFFSPKEYRRRNPDVSSGEIEAVEHYLRLGSFELREIGDEFDSPGYLLEYPDIAKAGENPLGHFLKSGRKAGRSPQPRKSGD